MDKRKPNLCPECDPLTRREFLKNAGLAAVAGAAGTALPVFAVPKAASAAGKTSAAKSETVVKSLYDSLSSAQREKIVLPWSHPNRARVDANWAIVEETVDGFFNPDQRTMIAEILQGVTSEEFHPKFMKQMQDDSGG